jgi:hypothetical protein
MNINTSCRLHQHQAWGPAPSYDRRAQMMRQLTMMMQMLCQSLQGGMLPASPNFGSSCGCPQSQIGPGPFSPVTGSPMTDFLGGSSGQVPMNAPTSAGNLQSNSNVASTLLNSIHRSPVPPRCRPGYCYRGVKHHLRQIGVNLTGGSAYQAADQLASSGRFREVQVSRGQLRSLPAGAVVVWNRGNGRRHGHISIATGDGREASDRIRRQITNYPNSYRVFLPS